MVYICLSTLQCVEYTDCIICRDERLHNKKGVLAMKLNCIRW